MEKAIVEGAEVPVENRVREIKTTPADLEAVKAEFASFIKSYRIGGGTGLRMERARTIEGQRLVIVFNYDDMS